MKVSPVLQKPVSAFGPAVLAALAAALAAGPVRAYEEDRNPLNHPIHSEERPRPPVIDPGPAGPPAPVPSDATVLFDGSGFDQWERRDGGEIGWEIEEDTMRVVPGTGDIRTVETFGDAQLYVEFKTPRESPGEAQHRGNSGVFFGPYEVQVLDSYENPTYADGQCGALYGQYPPLVNASRPPGEWQSFNIIYRAPVFEDGEVTESARFTVFHNNVLVQDSEELIGPSTHGFRGAYYEHGDVPVTLQDHNDDPLHFRNIWIRKLN